MTYRRFPAKEEIKLFKIPKISWNLSQIGNTVPAL